jgi:hypothetical protein
MKHHRWTLFAILLSAMLFTSACGVVRSLFGLSTSSGTVTELWSDVPRMDGLTKADLQMPVAARMALQAMTQDRFDFISFTIAATPSAVQEFYSEERMEQAGWDSSDARGCLGDTGDASVGAICVFGKETGPKNELLAVVVAKDDRSVDTQVFFARVVLAEDQGQ